MEAVFFPCRVRSRAKCVGPRGPLLVEGRQHDLQNESKRFDTPGREWLD